MRGLLLFLFAVLLGLGPVLAQSKKMELDKEAWKNSTKELNYTPEQKKEAKEKKEPRETESSELPDLSGFKYIAYGLVATLIIFLIVLILKNTTTVTAVESVRIEATSIEEAEENLPMLALTNIHNEALDKGDYKRALRITFLMILQRLIDAEMIVWKKRKTNQQYLLEIEESKLLVMFENAANLFDDAWYGEAQISEKQYGQIVAEFDLLKNEIGGGQE